MAIEIVDFPMKNGGSFHSYVTVYQRVPFESEKIHGLMVLSYVNSLVDERTSSGEASFSHKHVAI